MGSDITFSSTTNLLIVNDEQILLVKRNEHLNEFPGWYILPGGKQKENETPEETAIRETFEETGVKVNGANLRVIATHYHEYKSKVYLVYIFTADGFDGSLVESKEGTPEWMNTQEALNHPKLYPDLKRHIEIILGSKSDSIVFTYHRFNDKLEIVESR